MLRFRRATVAVLILLSFWPTLVFGQGSKAGIVTTLEGRATAARVVLPQPVPLHFKDDVFLNDEITTAEKSLARILLGGKAVVTVRERSSLTITEVPGLSTIDIASGKIAMAVARERLRPGEQIQIRTPNAITGIRGTSLIVEVIRSVADTKQPDPNAITRLGVFNGNVDVQHINPITKAPLAPPVNVAINTKFSASGTQPAAVAPFQPGDAASFQQGVTPSGPQHVQAANETALAAQAQETANALLTALGTGAVVAAPLAPTPTSTVDTQPELNDDNSTEVSCAEQPAQPGCAQPVVQAPAPPPPPPPVLRVPLPAGVPSNITIDPALDAFIGTAATSVLQIPSGSPAVATSGNAIEVATSAPTPALLTIPLLTVTDGDLLVRGHLLNVLGVLSSTTPFPLIALDPTTLTTTGDLVRVGPSALMSVTGPLVSDSGGTLNVGGSVISVEPTGQLAVTGERAAVELVDTNATIAGSLLRVDGGTAFVVDALVDATDARITADTLIELGGFGQFFTEGGAGALLRLGNGTDVSIDRGIVLNVNQGAVMILDRDVLQLNNARLTTAGPLLDMSSGLVFTSGLLASVENQSALTVLGPLVRVAGGGQFTADALLFSDDTGNQLRLGGLLEVSDSTVALSRLRRDCDCDVPDQITWTLGTNQPILRLTSGELIVTGSSTLIRREGNDEGLVPEPGVTLIATQAPGSDRRSSVIAESGTLFDFGGVHLTDPNAQLQLSGAHAEANNALIRVFRQARTAGPLLNAVNSGVVALRDELLGIDAPLLVDGTGDALLRFVDSFAVSGTEIVLIRPNGRLQLSRGLVDAVNTSFFTRSFDTFFTIAGGGSLEASTASPLISLTGSPVTQQRGEDFIHVGSSIFGSGGRASMTLTGGGSLVRLADMDLPFTAEGALLRVTDSNVSLSGPILEAVNANVSFEGPVVYLADGARLTTTAGPAFKVTGGSLTADSLIGSNGEVNQVTFTGTVADFTNTIVTLNRAESVGEGIIALNGGLNVPLLRMTSSTLTLTGEEPLFDLGVDQGTPVTVGGVVMMATGTVGSPSRVNVASLMDLGGVTFTDPNPQVQLTRTLLNQTTAVPLIEIFDLPVTTAGPLLTANLSTLNLGGPLLDVHLGSFAAGSAGDGALLQFAGSTLRTSSDVIVAGGDSAVRLNRGLIDATNSTFSASDSTGGRRAAFLAVVEGASLTTQGTSAPLLRFNGLDDGVSSVSVQDNFVMVAIRGGEGTTEPALTLAGPLLEANSTTLANGNPALSRGFLFVGDGGRLTSSSADALLTLRNSSVNTTGTMVIVRRSADEPSTMELAGSLLRAIDSSITARSRASADANEVERLCCNLLGIGQGGELTSTGTAPLIDLTNTGLTLGDRFAVLFDTTSILGEPTITGAASVTLAGPLARVVGGSITTIEDFLGVFRSSLTSTTSEPLITLTNTTVTAGGTSPINGATMAGRLLNLSASPGAPASLTLSGPLLSAAGTQLRTTDDLFGVFNGAELQSTTSEPLISITGGSAIAGPAGGFFVLAGADLPPTVSLAGGLLSATSTTVSSGDPTTASAFVVVFDSAILESTSEDALIELTSSTLNSTGSMVTVRRSRTSPSTVSLAGPLLAATDSLITAQSTTLRTPAGDPILCCNLLTVGEAAQFSSSSVDPLIDLTRTGVNVNRLVEVLDSTSIAGETPLPPAPAALSLNGGLLRSVGGSIATFTDLLGIFRSSLTTTDTADPLLSVDGTRLAIGGVSPFNGATTFGRILHMQGSRTTPGLLNLSGPLFVASNATITTTADAFSFFNGSHGTSTTTLPFISISGGSLNAADNGTFLGLASNPEQASSSLTLAGGLLRATNTTLTTGNPALNDITFVFVGDGAVLASTTVDPLLAFDNTAVATAGNIVTARRSRETPTTIALAGPLLSAVDSRFSTPTRSGFFVAEGARITSTSPLPLIDLTRSAFNAAPGSQAGFDFFTLTDSASAVALAGPFLRATNSQIDARPDLLSITGSTFSSTSSAPLIELHSSTLTASGAVARVADGKLLAATVAALANVIQSSSATTGLHGVDVSGANAVVQLKDLVRLTNSTMTVNSGHLVNMNGGQLNVSGNLVSLAGGSTLNILNGLLLNILGGTATIGSSLVSFSGVGNTVNVTNNVVPNRFLNGIPVFVGTGTLDPQISGTPLAGLTGNTIRINGQPLSPSATGSLIAVQNGATLRIGSTP